MKGPLVMLAALSLVGAAVVFLMVGPRHFDADVAAALVIGVLLGGFLDAMVLPWLVRTGNSVMRVRDRDAAG